MQFERGFAFFWSAPNLRNDGETYCQYYHLGTAFGATNPGRSCDCVLWTCKHLASDALYLWTLIHWLLDCLIDWLIKEWLRTFIRAGWVILILGRCIKNPSHFLNDCNFNRTIQKHPNLILVLVLLRNWPNSKQTRCLTQVQKCFFSLPCSLAHHCLRDHIISWWNPSPPQIETAGSMIARSAATKATSATFTFQKIHFGILHILINTKFRQQF